MKASVLRRHGDEDALEYLDWPDPVPTRGEVLIRVEACGLNHVDLDVRSGISRFAVRLPLILGREIGGVVVACGPGVTELRVGDRVAAGEMLTACWKCEQCLGGFDNLCWNVDYAGLFRDGGYAELVALPERYCLPLPDGVSTRDAAATQIAFGTAWRALLKRGGGLVPAETVLVTAAASGVGTAVIQVAKLVGATVIAAVRDVAKAEEMKRLGADHVVTYGTGGFERSVQDFTTGRGVDLVVEIAGGPLFTQSMRSLRQGGRLIIVGAHAGEEVPTDLIPIFRYERAVIGTARATRGEMIQMMKALAAGNVHAVIDRTFALKDAAAAHRYLASRENIGKVLLAP